MLTPFERVRQIVDEDFDSVVFESRCTVNYYGGSWTVYADGKPVFNFDAYHGAIFSARLVNALCRAQASGD